MNARLIVVMPAYNAAETLTETIRALPPLYERIILCDDASDDATIRVARKFNNVEVLTHARNRGYGGNQKTLYNRVKKLPCDIVAMVHPDNQYDTTCIQDAIEMIIDNKADMVLGTRMATAKELGMPWWKRGGNRLLSTVQRRVFRTHLSEFHSGLRVFHASLLSEMPYETFSDDFVFDSQVLAWCFGHKKNIREVPTRCFYRPETSSINLRRSMKYGFATLLVLLSYRFGTRYRSL